MSGDSEVVADWSAASHGVLGRGDDAVTVLAPIDLVLHAGTIVVLAGPSGSGKTTLCHLLLGWDEPTTGRIELHPAGVAAASIAPTAGQSWAQRSCAPQRQPGRSSST